MLKHTPGPWHAKRSQHNYRRWNIWREGNDADRACIAETAFWLDSDPPDEEMANAVLMASAPDLLEALIDCQMRLKALTHPSDEQTEYAIKTAQVAIAKATEDS